MMMVVCIVIFMSNPTKDEVEVVMWLNWGCNNKTWVKSVHIVCDKIPGLKEILLGDPSDTILAS